MIEFVLPNFVFGAFPSSAQTGNPGHDAPAAANPGEQRATLARFVLTDGQASCGDITSFFNAGLDPSRRPIGMCAAGRAACLESA